MKGEFDLDEKKFKHKKILQVPITQVVPGMMTARDIYSMNDQLILTKDVVLESNTIAKIMFYAIPNIYIYNDKEEKEFATYQEEIQASEEFKKFDHVYKDVLNDIQSAVNQMVTNDKKLNQQELNGYIKRIIVTGKSKYHLLELITCIRDFDDLTFAHSINVALICSVFGEWLHMSEDDKDVLTMCGLLHDIGKIMIPSEILGKPGKLTKEEFDIIKEHPEQGYLILLSQNVDHRVRLAALQHHERYDGGGYPLGKDGDNIDEFSMIVAIADVYDAMTSTRVYRDAMCPFTVLKMFQEEGRHQYNIKYLLPLMERIAEVYINHTVRLSNDMTGEVIMLNHDSLAQPVIRVKDMFMDLSKQRDIYIEEVI